MNVKGFILVVVLSIALSGCRNLSDLPFSDTELPVQEEASFVPLSDIAVTFADPIIEAAVRGILEKPDGDITEAELLKITVLGDAGGTGGAFGDVNGEITTLSDLKWLKNLTTLSLGGCGIKSLIGVEELEHLEILRLRRNDISDLEPLRNLVQLKELDLSENPICDTSSLCNLVNIESLGLGDCGKINLAPVRGMSKLKRLSAPFSNITDISMLRDKIDLDIPSEYTYFNDNPSYWDDNLGFAVEDMNFDGYADIRIVEFLPTGPNVPYTCWVWDKKAGQYVYDSELSAITSLEVDFENKLIRSIGRASAVEHFEEYYRYIDGSLLRIKEVRTGLLDGSDPNQGYSITHELINGQWVMTQKEKIEING